MHIILFTVIILFMNLGIADRIPRSGFDLDKAAVGKSVFFIDKTFACIQRSENNIQYVLPFLH